MLVRPEVNKAITTEMLYHHPHFGKQIISESICREYTDEVQLVPTFGHIVINSEGIYGMILGGNNGIACFVGWCVGIGPWAFNPISIDDYIWSIVNNAYISKSLTEIRNVRLVPREFYYYNKDSNGNMSRFFKRKAYKEIVLWEK